MASDVTCSPREGVAAMPWAEHSWDAPEAIKASCQCGEAPGEYLTPERARALLAGRRVLFVGNSVLRQSFWGVMDALTAHRYRRTDRWAEARMDATMGIEKWIEIEGDAEKAGGHAFVYVVWR